MDSEQAAMQNTIEEPTRKMTYVVTTFESDGIVDAEELKKHIEEFIEEKRQVAKGARPLKGRMSRQELLDMLKGFGEWFKGWAIDVFLFRLFDCLIVAFLLYLTKKHRWLNRMLGWIIE